jgi:thymidylate kinase
MSNVVELVPGLLEMPPGSGEHSHGKFEAQALLLKSLFERWNARELRWTVLRNASELPFFTRYDVDILVAPENYCQMLSVVEEVVSENEWNVVGRINKRHYACLLLECDAGNEGPLFLPLDFFTALEYRGYSYLDVESALSARIRTDKGVWTLPDTWQAAITLLKEWFPHGQLKVSSRESVHAVAIADPGGVAKLLRCAVGDWRSERLLDVAMSGNWDSLLAIPRPRRQMLLHCHGWLLSLWANICHLFRRSLGRVVCLAGADGSGKSTLAHELAMALYKRPFKGVRYVHGNIGVLPRFRDMRIGISRKRKYQASDEGPEYKPLKGMMEPIPAWKSILLATYYAFDFFLARLRIRRWRGQWMLVILDRSFYDYYYQLGHRNCPHWYLDLLQCFVPKPDVLLCLEDMPEVIHRRKPELTPEEIALEQKILSSLSSRLPYAHRLKCGNGIRMMGDDAVQIILDTIISRGRDVAG